MIKSALEYIVKLGETEIFEFFDGQSYSTKDLYHVESPSPVPLRLSTLKSLIDYVSSFCDGDDFVLHVESPTVVKLLSAIKQDKTRDCFIECKALVPDIRFDCYYDSESFNIMLQSKFVSSATLAELLALVGNIKEETVRNTGDDGIAQTVTAKAGVALVADVKVPNPVVLAPRRTFVEVEQPESAFILRLKDGPSCALFEADGGEWRIEAIRNVEKYLCEELKDYDNIQILA